MATQREVEQASKGCEICEQPTNVLNIIPKRRADGSLVTLACTPCAQESDMYCDVHQRPHIGFADGETTACVECIEEEVEKDGTKIATAFQSGVSESPHCLEISFAMDQYIDLAVRIKGGSREQCMARPIVTAAKRFKKSTDEIIAETFEKGPNVLFPREQ
jgi:hypothetical protein